MRDTLDRSILRTILVYMGIQATAFSSFGMATGFFSRYALWFFVICMAFHLFLYSLLRIFKSDFSLAETGQALEKINLANLITLFRVSCLPTLLFMVIASKDYHKISVPLLVVVLIVFASDFVDGWVSRATKQVTRIGKMMDSFSDYMVLVVLTIVFYYFHFVEAWFFVLVMGRLAIQTVFIVVLYIVHGKIRSRTTLFGKIAIASIMVLYGAEILEKILMPSGLMAALHWLQWAAAIIVGASVIDKIIAFLQDLRSEEPKKDGEIRDMDGGS